MKSKKILVVLLVVVGLALVLGGCKDTGSPVGGTVTIMLTGAGDLDAGAEFNAGIFVSLEDLTVDDEALAGITVEIVGGLAADVIELVPAGTYQLGAFIDENSSGEYEVDDPLLSGVIFTVNGDTTVTVDYGDFDLPS